MQFWRIKNLTDINLDVHDPEKNGLKLKIRLDQNNIWRQLKETEFFVIAHCALLQKYLKVIILQKSTNKLFWRSIFSLIFGPECVLTIVIQVEQEMKTFSLPFRISEHPLCSVQLRPLK